MAAIEEVTIETIGARGDGIAPGPLYAPFTLPGERVQVRRDADRADLLEVLQPSPDRVTPPCPHFFQCGGCALQHWDHAPYLAWKGELVRTALLRERLEPEVLPAFGAPPESRRRFALHARPDGKGGARLGYKVRGAWTLVDIAVCPISDPRLQAAIPGLKRLARPFLNHPKSAPTLHVTLTLTGLDIDISGVEQKTRGLSADARMRAAEAAQAMDDARVTMDGEMIFMARQPIVRLGPATVALPPGAFLQAVPQAERAMADFVRTAAAGAGRIADLFCGVGTFTFALAEVAPVLAADGDAPAVRALSAAAGTAPGLKTITAEARDLFRRPYAGDELKKIDTVVFDPPRAGALDQVRHLATSKVQRVIGVSCNVATFARDARVLVDAGFRLEQVLPVDQFLWSPHVELVGVFRR